MSVTIVGTVALDSIETPKGKFENILGGSATFAGVAAGLFSPVDIVSIVGEDFPSEHISFLQANNINTDGVLTVPGKTFHWSGYYKDDMNQAYTIATDLNVLLEFDPTLPEAAANRPYLFLANLDPVIQKQVILQSKSPKLIVLDTMNYWIETKITELKDVLKLVDVLIINDQELRLLTGQTNIIPGLPEVLKLGPKRVIVKKGEHGSVMYNGSDYFLLPAFPLPNLIDPTGAGDSFAGGFVGYLAKAGTTDEATFQRAMIAGTLISSHTVQGFSLEPLKTLTLDHLDKQFAIFRSYAGLPEGI